MRNIFTFLTTALLFTSFAQAQTAGFKPMSQSTTTFQLWADKEFQDSIQGGKGICTIVTTLHEDDQTIEFQMGVPGTDFDLFGYGMNLPLADFPLKAGYKKTFSEPGTPTMNLSYDGTTLSFVFAKDDELLERIYPFALVIDANLTHAVTLDASMQGYESSLGIPKTHVTTSCKF